MAENGLLGDGVKIAYSASSPVNWTRVGQVLDVDIPGLDPDEVETTVHGTTAGLRRHIRGLIDVTEMEMHLLADLDETTNAAQDALFDYQASAATIWWRVEVPTARDKSKFVAFEFQGWVKKWHPAAPIDDKQTLMASVRFDGDSFTKYPAGSSAIS